MRPIKRALLTALFASLVMVAANVERTAQAGDAIQHGALKIETPWSRATPPGAKVAAGYLTIINTGDVPDRLVAAKTEIAGRTEIHEMTMDNGVMRMRALPDGVAIAPGATEVLKPGGNHVMFMALRAGIKTGDEVKVTLTFEKAGDIDVVFPAAKIGAMSPGGKSGSGGHGHHGTKAQ